MSSHVHDARALLLLPANRPVTSVLEGGYLARHPGRSTELVDLREYVDGDDPKDIDWKASARSRALHVRRQHAHRKLTVLLALSTGRSMAGLAAGPLHPPKSEVALGVVGVLGTVAGTHGDLVGLVTGDAAAQQVHRPRGGFAHLERCLSAAQEAMSASSGASDLPGLLDQVARSARRPCVVVLVIDDVTLHPEALRLLTRLRGRHEVLVVAVDGADPFRLDPARHAAVSDVDTDLPLPLWLRRDEQLAAEHAAAALRDRTDLDRALDRLGLAHVHVDGTERIVPALARLFDRHRRAGRR